MALPNNANEVNGASTRLVIRHAISYLPASVLPSLLSLCAVYVFTRSFSLEKYGVYSLVLSITTPATVILTEWIAQPTNRYFAEYEAAERSLDLVCVVEQAFIRMFIVTTVLSAILLAVDLRVEYLGLYALAGAYVLVVSRVFIAIGQPFLTAAMRPKLYTRVTVLSSATSVALSLGLVALFGSHVACILWGGALSNLVVVPLISRWTGLRFAVLPVQLTGLKREMMLKLRGYGLPLVVWFVSAALLYSEDRYILAIFRGTAEVALYSVNYNFLAIASGILIVPVTTALGPVLYSRWSMKDVAAAQRTLSAMTEVFGFIAAFLFGGVVASGDAWTHVLFGRAFWTGLPLLIPILGGRLLWGVSMLGQKGFELDGKTRNMAAAAAAAAVVNVMLNLVLVPRFGVIGSAYSTLVGYGTYFFLVMRGSRTGLRWVPGIPRLLAYMSLATLLGWISSLLSAFALGTLATGAAELGLYLLLFAPVAIHFYRRRWVFLSSGSFLGVDPT